jgi:hypothetical protein
LPLVESLMHETRFKSVAAFRVNFDTQKEFLRTHRVRWQTTLVVFKGEKEVGRSTADINKGSIRNLFLKGL